MRVVVTGAAGRLGRRVCEELRGGGHEVRGVDRAAAEGDHTVADLLDPAVAAEMAQGMDAVVHTAGRLGCHEESGQAVYVENLTMAHHVFSAAADAGVRKVILASSIQVIGWGGQPERAVWGFVPEYLPLDDQCERRARTLYALGKGAMEDLLKFYAEAGAYDAVSLRLPRLMEGEDYRAFREKMAREKRLWIGMSYRQAARLAARCLETALPGYRAYLAADEDIGDAAERKEFLKAHYPEVACRAGLEGLVDCSRVTEETGWRPARWEEEEHFPLARRRVLPASEGKS